MNAHRSLSRVDVQKYSPAQIALMVASEFLRASTRAHHASIANGCLHRARELMGILETLPLDANVALELSPIYYRCTEDQLIVADRMPAEQVRTLGLELATVFEKASEALAKASHA